MSALDWALIILAVFGWGGWIVEIDARGRLEEDYATLRQWLSFLHIRPGDEE